MQLQICKNTKPSPRGLLRGEIINIGIIDKIGDNN